MKRMRAGLAALAAALLVGFLGFPGEAPPAKAQDVDKIEAAVKKGVGYLTKGGASWTFMDMSTAGQGDNQNDVGVAALIGLALIESDVNKNDASVQRAYGIVKKHAPTLNKTYPLGLAVFFLSRYNSPSDTATIKQLCLRLMAAQHVGGAWSYDCNVLNAQQQSEWEKWFREREKLTKVDPAESSGAPPAGGSISPDNSNTQFALLALWLGRKSGVPVKYALLRGEERFRKSQQGNGGWGYGMGGQDHTGAGMTCAGLLALAVGHGNTLERQAKFTSSGSGGDSKDSKPVAPASNGLSLDQLQDDPAVKSARNYIEMCIRNGDLEHFIYFLWSLERVAVVYGWDKDHWPGGWDWYSWASDILLKKQNQTDGSWGFEYGKSVDTAFALLILRRANLLGDLTKRAKFTSGDGRTASTGAKAPVKSDAPPAAEKASDGLPSDPKELAKELITSTGSKRELILLKMREGKGSEFTSALAESIPQLSGTDQRLARDALAKRMERLTSKSLGGYMEESDKEMQLAAARAMGAKSLDRAKEGLSALIGLLDSFEDNIKDAAYESLKSISMKDFGRATSSWKAWWSKESGAN